MLAAMLTWSSVHVWSEEAQVISLLRLSFKWNKLIPLSVTYHFYCDKVSGLMIFASEYLTKRSLSKKIEQFISICNMIVCYLHIFELISYKMHLKMKKYLNMICTLENSLCRRSSHIARMAEPPDPLLGVRGLSPAICNLIWALLSVNYAY